MEPSPAASLTAVTAMRPAAPTRFSTITLPASLPRHSSAVWRAVASAVPPAGKPQMMRASGGVCARVDEGATKMTLAAPISPRRVMVM
jgi:hypothetical protein